MSSIHRRLSLHASALSDNEYQLYTTSLLSIVSVEDDGAVSSPQSSNNMDDAYYENMKINVRETRAWLRGRYSHLPSLIIDKILKLFSQNLSATDCLSGGEFFAVLRLIVHAENGKEVDRSLAFVQAQAGPISDSVPPRTDRTISTSPSSVAESPLHNPFIHPQPPLHPSQRSESSATSSPISAHNPFVHRNVPTRSDSGNTKLPPLPPRKPLVAPIPPPMIASPSKHINRSRSPSKPISSTTNPPPPPLLPHPPTIPPKPSHHITSTLIKQSLQATKAAQTMKKAEEQLDRERVMQVLKSSSTVSGAYPLAGASVTNSSVVVGTHVYNQHQYRSSSPTGQQGGGGGLNNRKLAYAESSISSSSDERAPPLPKRRTQQQQQQRQPSPPLSASSFEQVALASTHHHHSTSAPPSSTNTAFSNPETSDNAHTLGGGQQPQPRKTSSFHSRPRFPLDSNLAIPYTSSPERSPSRTSLDFQNGTTTTTRGRPPPTHPDRKPHHLQQQQQQQDYPKPKSHSRSQSYPYPDPFAGSSSGFKQPQEQHPPTNVNESFEKIYGPSTINTNNPPTPSTPPTTIDVTPSTPSPNRAFRSKSLHQLTPPVPPVPRPLGRKRPESVQVSRMSDIGGEVDQNEANKGVSSSRHVAMTANGNNRDGIIRRSSLSVSTTMPSSSSSPSQFRQTQTPFGIPSSSSTTANLSGPPPPPSSSSASSSSTTTMKQQDPTHPNPLASLQKTFLQFQPHLDKARYKAEAGLSKRGFVRREGFRRNKSSGSAGGCVDGDGEEEEDGFMEDGLEGLMNSNGNGNGNHDGGGVKKQIGKSRWRDVSAAGTGVGVDGEVDQDSDWTRSKGMSMSRKGRVQDSDGDDEEESSLEKDNLKWPVGEGWKPL